MFSLTHYTVIKTVFTWYLHAPVDVRGEAKHQTKEARSLFSWLRCFANAAISALIACLWPFRYLDNSDDVIDKLAKVKSAISCHPHSEMPIFRSQMQSFPPNRDNPG